MARFFPKKRPHGFSMIELMVAGAVIGTIVLALAKMATTSRKALTNTQAIQTATLIKNNATRLIDNPVAWGYTVADTANANLNCLRNNAPCTTESGAFNLRDTGNAIAVDTSTGKGFTEGGAMCDGFVEPTPGGTGNTGNPKCPFRLELAWMPVCVGACLNPVARVMGTLKYNTSAEKFSPLNTANFGFDITRGISVPSLESACDMIGGIFSAGPPPNCNLAPRICPMVGGTVNGNNCTMPTPSPSPGPSPSPIPTPNPAPVPPPPPPPPPTMEAVPCFVPQVQGSCTPNVAQLNCNCPAGKSFVTAIVTNVSGICGPPMGCDCTYTMMCQ